MRAILRRAIGAIAVAGVLSAAGAVAAEVRGLVVGIDDYAHLSKLEGAVNDARDVADALRGVGAGDVTVLLDRAATREAVMRSWNEAIARSAPGDVLVFHYAGHGGQSPERVKGSEPTGMDSVLLLAGFAATKPGNRERIVDDEVHTMLKQATDARLTVLFVTDSCHSGTMTRGFDSRLPQGKVRAATYGPITDDALPPADRGAAFGKIEDLPNVLSLGAVQDHELAPEILIDGKVRGALSWSLARGIRGKADLNADGGITDEEMHAFVQESVRIVMQGKQHPSIQRTRAVSLPLGLIALVRPLVGGGQAAAKLPSKEQPPPPAETAKADVDPGALPVLTLRPINVDRAAVEAWARGAKADGITPVVGDGAADLIWDVARGEVLNGLGDLVAYVGAGAHRAGDPTRAFGRTGPADAAPAPAAVQAAAEALHKDWPEVRGVADKWRLVAALRDRASGGGLRMSLAPGDRYHRRGERVTVTVTGMRHANFALLDLTSDGSVIVLYPQPAEERTPHPKDRPFAVKLEVEPPFGADHFLAISTDAPLAGMLDALRQTKGRPAALELARLIAGPELQIGLHGVYTAPGGP